MVAQQLLWFTADDFQEWLTASTKHNRRAMVVCRQVLSVMICAEMTLV